MNMKPFKTVLLLPVIATLLLFTTGCIDIMAYKSKTEIIADGKGIRAPEFKLGTYTDFSEKPQNIRFHWNDRTKEYEIEKKGSRGASFRLIRLKGSNYLLQGKEENYFQYSIITFEGDLLHFFNFKEEKEKKVEALIKKHDLTVNPEDRDDLTGSRKELIAFFKSLLKKGYLEYGEKLKYLPDKEP
jgi:hypothetical protein